MVRDAHPEQEERRARSELVEQVEQGKRLPLQGGVRSVPVREPEPPVHQLVPVLEVDRQQQPRLLHGADCNRPGSDPCGVRPQKLFYAGPSRGLAETTRPLPPSFAR